MICRECGARIDDDAIECKFCGAVYGNEQDAAEPEVPVDEEILIPEEDEIEELFDENEAKRQVQVEKIRVEKQTQLEEIEKRRKDRKRKQRRNILLIALLVVLLGGAVAAGVYYITPKNSGDRGDVVIVTQAPTEKAVPTEKPEEEQTPEPTVEPEEEQTPEPTAEPEIVTETEAPGVSYATAKPVATKKPVATAKPLVKSKLSSATITGGEVIKANGQSYMSFIYNNKWYYAKVSADTTTNFIAWKKMTVSGYTNGETYKGVPVYTLTQIKHQNSSPASSSSQPVVSQQTGSSVFADSSTRLLTSADLQGKTAYQLRLARNEIYARHGRKFNDASLQNHFNACSWYKVNPSYNYANENANLNEIEKANIIAIRNAEN